MELYDDDGETFDYEKGNFAKAVLSVKKDKRSIERKWCYPKTTIFTIIK